MTTLRNPYDELPYRSRPIAWTAPERLALCSLLHGGPRPLAHGYRVLELGCGDGSNLIALAFYRQAAEFVGVDGSARAIATAEQRRAELDLGNMQFLHADLTELERAVRGPFHFILMHGVFSWVRPALRDQLLRQCGRLLHEDGLLYLNYNTRPGWNMRGLVRDLLLAQTAHVQGLLERARAAQAVASITRASLAGQEHPFAKLLEHECEFVMEGDLSYVAHEFLAPDNHPLWQSEFVARARDAGLWHVADADFNYPSGRIAEGLSERIRAAGLKAEPLEDTVDLLSYRQLHSPVLAHAARSPRAMTAEEFAALYMASATKPTPDESNGKWRLVHASGFEVEIRDAVMYRALLDLAGHFPHGLRASELFDDCSQWRDDVLLMQRYGTLELRTTEPVDLPDAERLNACERRWGGYATSPFHDARAA